MTPANEQALSAEALHLLQQFNQGQSLMPISIANHIFSDYEELYDNNLIEIESGGYEWSYTKYKITDLGKQALAATGNPPSAGAVTAKRQFYLWDIAENRPLNAAYTSISEANEARKTYANPDRYGVMAGKFEKVTPETPATSGSEIVNAGSEGGEALAKQILEWVEMPLPSSVEQELNFIETAGQVSNTRSYITEQHRVIHELYSGKHGSIPHPAETWKAGLWEVYKPDEYQAHGERVGDVGEFEAQQTRIRALENEVTTLRGLAGRAASAMGDSTWTVVGSYLVAELRKAAEGKG